MQRKTGIDYTQRRKAGNIGEDAVCGFLVRHGYEIIKRNFTVRGGEIDIIAEKADIIAFVEVKTREHGSLISAEELLIRSSSGVSFRQHRLFVRGF